MNEAELVFAYHERSKHDYYRSAPSLGYLDWDNQPDPFRRFINAPLHKLTLPEEQSSITYPQLYFPANVPSREVSLDSISELFFYSLSLSSWKGYEGTRWALRVNPSSGNLHPTEAYLVIGPNHAHHLLSGTYHYAPKEHALECRTEFSQDTWSQLVMKFPKGSFFVGLSSIHWREAWKYGERAFRYCQHDVGHALAALRLSATMLGWNCHRLECVSDPEIAQLLGLNRHDEFVQEEYENPDLLVVITPTHQSIQLDLSFSTEMLQSIAAGTWFGKANRLSEDHYPWEAIEAVSQSCHKQSNDENLDEISKCFKRPCVDITSPTDNDKAEGVAKHSAGSIIRQRRSAVSMDGSTSISKLQFYDILSRLVPSISPSPWDCTAQPAFVHLGLFVHRVESVPSGLYMLVRNPEKKSLLQSCTHAHFRWSRPVDCPEALPLFFLEEGDVEGLASSLSCGQDIAGSGVFSCGMLTEFETPIHQYGPHWYRRLFWETGMVGQVLYLEAEAQGIRGTGIGCFFDNPVHETFGLKDRTFQSLYHFTIGGPVDDNRLMTLPAY
ncbi:MAG: SagB/ThcOx family dehydrogenase [SAR324 cluster bacterium]|nr:SagB/ThcOx family dehydrogenase [SAR324 cluster bacterium]